MKNSMEKADLDLNIKIKIKLDKFMTTPTKNKRINVFCSNYIQTK